MDIILIKKDCRCLESPSYSVAFSDYLSAKLPELFSYHNIMHYSIWDFRDHFILIERRNDCEGPTSLRGVFDLVHKLEGAEKRLEERAISYARELKQKLLLEHGLETELFIEEIFIGPETKLERIEDVQ